MNVGNKIKLIRESRNLTQEYVADAVGMSQANYSKIESNQSKLSFNKLEQIAEVLEVDVIKLLQVEDNWHINQVSNSQLGSGSYFEQTGIQEIQRLYQDQIKNWKKKCFF